MDEEARGGEERKGARTVNPGVNIPAVTTKLLSTKHDMRKGRNTGSPVSSCCQPQFSPHLYLPPICKSSPFHLLTRKE